jgi:hypothetical protein
MIAPKVGVMDMDFVVAGAVDLVILGAVEGDTTSTGQWHGCDENWRGPRDISVVGDNHSQAVD